jgi:hypothetical protein
MKRIRWIVLAAALIGPGCLNLPFHPQEPAKPFVPPKAPPAPPPPAVTADGITEANARSKADALARELDYAGAREMPNDQ